jgi:uncharacterized repeat protein (TIGR03803 family)
MVKRLGIALAAVAAFAALPAHATQQKTLYSFCAKFSCTDGSSPTSDLGMDAAGNLYGTTSGGGSASSGAVFELKRDAGTGKWQRIMLHSFCHGGYPCADGTSPTGKLVIDSNGNLYGTASAGGHGDGGVAFTLLRDSATDNWSFRVLHTFCLKSGCTDGKTPTSGLAYQGEAAGAPYDGSSPLYGSTQSGGSHGGGTAFKLTPVAGKSAWSASVTYAFCARANCTDGAAPSQALLMDASGNLFGVTQGNGSAPQSSVAFELSPRGGQGPWTDTVLHRFCQLANCSDGAAPNALVADSSGALFATARNGGAHGQGLLFKLSRAGSGWSYRVLYNFCAQDVCADGAAPASVLTLGADGALYGTTYYGGGNTVDRDGLGGGTVFRLSAGGSYSILHAFCAVYLCADGEYPTAGVLLDASGVVYGTTQLGGRHTTLFQGGTAFRMTH